MNLNDKVIMVTGGTGSFGKHFIKSTLKKFNVKKIIVFSRDELKQLELKKELDNDKIRYIIGDVQNYEDLYHSTKNVDIIIHAAALKQIDTAEYNPVKFIDTNIIGVKNVINTAIENKVKKIVALSTDKASLPISLYGGTKFIGDKLFQSAFLLSPNHELQCCVVRYGNVAGSRGSVIPYFKKLIQKGEEKLPLTHLEMTRFWITLDEAVDMVNLAIQEGQGGEIFIKKIPSFKILDLIYAFECDYKIIGLRSNEKIHEQMINDTDLCYEFIDHYRLYPRLKHYNIYDKKIDGAKRKTINYTSDYNKFLTIEQIKERIK